MNAKGFLKLTLSTSPILRTFQTQGGGTQEYYELTLSDGTNILEGITATKDYNYTNLEVGKTYCFAIVPRKKSCMAVSKNNTQFYKKYFDFKIVGVYDDIDMTKFKDLIVMK